MLELYDYLPSGNGYKVRLVLHQLGHRFRLIERDIALGETRTPAFLELNPNGRIPVLVLEDGRALAESNAILCYLGEGTPLVPSEAFDRAKMLEWMFFEQYSHEPYIAVVRAWLHVGLGAPSPEQIEERRQRGYQALGVMERRLGDHPFLVADRYTLADVALYAYTHVAHEGGFDLAPYPGIRAWLERVAGQPRHVPITRRDFL